MTDLAAQFINLFWMAVFGLITSFFWEAGKTLTEVWVKQKAGRAVIDFFSCCLLGILFWKMLLWLNGGVLRNYVILGCLLGLFLYRKVFGRFGKVFWKKFWYLWRPVVKLRKTLQEKYSQDVEE